MKRILAFALVLILTVIPMTVSAKQVLSDDVSAVTVQDDAQTPAVAADTGFTPRLSAPAKSNSYYYSNKNIFYSIGYGMPNCTAYAWGRAYELLGTAPKLSVDSAHYWWNYNKNNGYYPYGSTPKLGAIACWDNPYGGHVAVVEQITSSKITLSHSEWAGRTFYTTEFSPSHTNGGVNSSGWKFQGYIYILDGEVLPEGDVYRVNSSNGVNLRKGAGTSYQTLTAIPDKTEIVVTQTAKANGYTWGKTTYAGYTGWCVLDFCTLIYQKPAETPPAVEDKPVDTPTETPEVTPPEDDIPSTILPDEMLPDNGDALLPDTSPAPPVTSPAPPASDDDEATKDEVNGDATADESKVDWADINGDGKTNISDVTLLQKFVASMGVSVNTLKADANGDGKISVADATYIQKSLAGLDARAALELINNLVCE